MAPPAGVPEWPKGAGCKPAGSAFGGSNPPPCTPVQPPADPVSDGPRPDRSLSEDEIAREMIERISRQVDLESGVVPRQSEPEDEVEGTTREGQPPGDESVERSEEKSMRELVERIAQEVDAEGRG